LAAALALLGQTEEAQEVGKELLALDPNYSVSKLATWYPLKSKSALEQLTKGLLLAGLPA
jgi:hypothetical protein